jgi:sulfite reductase alpha subunit-like flavoprotein
VRITGHEAGVGTGRRVMRLADRLTAALARARACSDRQPTRTPSSEECPVNVLIVYGTTEGQTRKIAEWTATYARERGHQVELRNSAALISDLDLETFDAFIIAASVHQQHHQETIANFVIAHHVLLNARLGTHSNPLTHDGGECES